MNLASFIEHSFLKPATTIADIELLCDEASQNAFAAVCIPPMFVKKAKALVSNDITQVATVIGFPFGYNAIESKVAEAVLAIVDGADELDVMINLVALKSKDWQYLAKEISTILTVTKKSGKKIKVIIEAGLLKNEEIIACCDIYGAAGADFLQTSTGFRQAPVTIEQLKLMRNHLADAIQLKVADPVNSLLSANEWIAAGATRIVCSNPLQIIKESANAKDGMIFGNEKAYKN
jgi:deoxyribose-phosphate aldolase